MHDTILVRYDEIGIKGKNRTMFERALADNIASCLRAQDAGFTRIERRRGRILVHTPRQADLSRVFGISSFSPAIHAGTSIDGLMQRITPYLTLSAHETFRVTCQRLDKTFPVTSSDVCRQLGAFIVQKTGAKVRLVGADKDFLVEIIHGALYFCLSTTSGAGGLPAGTEGTVLAFIDSERAERAALAALRRGCDLVAVLPVQRPLPLLDRYSCGRAIKVQAGSIDMLDAIGNREHAKAAVVGDTLHDLREYPTSLPVLRPLVGAA